MKSKIFLTVALVFCLIFSPSRSEAKGADAASALLVSFVAALAVAGLVSHAASLPVALMAVSKSKVNLSKMSYLQLKILDEVKNVCGMDLFRALTLVFEPGKVVREDQIERINVLLQTYFPLENDSCRATVQEFEMTFPIAISSENKSLEVLCES